MSAHTPGPWTYKPPVTVNERPVVKRGDEGILWMVGTSRERERADGHLIAAAPDLFAAAEQVVNGIKAISEAGGPIPAFAGLAATIAALKKARGEQ